MPGHLILCTCSPTSTLGQCTPRAHLAHKVLSSALILQSGTLHLSSDPPNLPVHHKDAVIWDVRCAHPAPIQWLFQQRHGGLLCWVRTGCPIIKDRSLILGLHVTEPSARLLSGGFLPDGVLWVVLFWALDLPPLLSSRLPDPSTLQSS